MGLEARSRFGSVRQESDKTSTVCLDAALRKIKDFGGPGAPREGQYGPEMGFSWAEMS